MKRIRLWPRMALPILLSLPLAGFAQTAWFVVASPIPGLDDSYLLPLSSEAHIALAREQVARDPGSRQLLSASVAPGSDGFNRDILAEGQPLWSWHINGFSGFADAAIELCDGTPTLLEADVRGFLQNTGNVICFWSYQVVEELESPPEFRINTRLNGGWFEPATAGQGLLMEVLEAQGQVFAAWFTYEAGATKIGAPEHRWFTAQGPFQESRAELDIVLTTGGRFDDPQPVENAIVGELIIEFSDCNHGLASYRLDDGPEGEIAIQKIAPIPTCGQP